MYDTGASIPILSSDQKLCTSFFGPPFLAARGEEEMHHNTDDDKG